MVSTFSDQGGNIIRHKLHFSHQINANSEIRKCNYRYNFTNDIYRYSDKTTHKNGIYNSLTPTNTHCHIATATALYRYTCSLYIGIHLSPFFPSPRKLWPPKPRHRDCGGVLHHPGATKVSRFGSLRYVSSLFSMFFNTKSIVIFPCPLDVFNGNSLTHWLLQSMCSPYTNPMETISRSSTSNCCFPKTSLWLWWFQST